jgi:two-component system response regulator HydG
MTAQSRFLRVLQESEIEPVGGVHPRKIDVRVIAATNRNLAEEVKKGIFREDLYYRLKVVQITLPPLRERTEDIPVMVTKFISEFNKLHNRTIEGISKDALASLRMYSWPGNVRELRNMIEGMVVITSNRVIEVDDLPSEVSTGSELPLNIQLPVGHTLNEVEETLIRQTLEVTGGNRTRASDILGISLRTLQRKIKLLTGKGDSSL